MVLAINMAELHIKSLVKNFGATPILKELNLHVASGCLTAILGPSGSGKSTLLRMICGFERPDAGTISIDGKIISGPGMHVPTERRLIGYVPQEGALFPHLSVADNIVFGLERSQRRARHRVQELLELVGLPLHFADRAPQQLSGGQQQRVALARVLAPNPALVLLDEPFSALDASLRSETRAAVANALRETGATGILVTHDQSEALSIGQQVAILWDGRLEQTGTPQAVYTHPLSAAIANFLGEAVLLKGHSAGGIVHCALGTLKALPGAPEGEVLVMIRPEQICLTPLSRASDQSCVGGVEARVMAITFNGHDGLVALQSVSGDTSFTARVPSNRLPRLNETVAVAVDGAVVAYPLGAGN